MSAPAAPAPSAPAASDPTATPAPARRWRGRAGAALVVAALVAVPVVGVLLVGSPASTPLDPDTAAPAGSRAVAELLRGAGITVDRVERSDAALDALAGGGGAGTGGSTLVVTDPDLLDPARLTALADAAGTVVLLAPGPEALAAVTDAVEVVDPLLGVPADPSAPDDAPVAGAGCQDPAAVAAGTAAAGGLELAATGPGATTCFDGSYAVVRAGGVDEGADEGGRVVAVLSQGAVVSNARLDEDGNAALALWTLGARDRVVWLVASPLDAAAVDEPPGVLGLAPGWVRWTALQLLVVAVVVVVWRSRRLGALVAEPLPVVVRATEAVEGRAALYRAAQDRPGTARVLRAAATARAAERLGLPPGTPPEEVARAVAAATGRDPAELRELLAGAPPRDDAQLVALARALRDLPRPPSAVPTTAAPPSPHPSPPQPQPPSQPRGEEPR